MDSLDEETTHQAWQQLFWTTKLEVEPGNSSNVIWIQLIFVGASNLLHISMLLWDLQ